jgi:hypothetical protein
MDYDGEKYRKSERAGSRWQKRADQTNHTGAIRTPAAMDTERAMKNP